MAEEKSIKLLLTNGSLSGLLTAEMSKWEGIFFSSPRSSYQLLSNEIETKYWGVYLLVSEDKVYIGQANELLRRISEHEKTKEWWEKVVLITTRNNSLNKSDIDYLESKLIQIAKSNGTLDLDNIKSGNLQKVDRYREPELNDLIEGGLLLLELIGVKVFTKETRLLNRQSSVKAESSIFKNMDVINYDNQYHYNKSKVISFLVQKHHLNFSNCKVNYAILQEKKNTFWINPQVNVLKGKWILVLNNHQKRTFTILEIPPNEFNVNSDRNAFTLCVRNDRRNIIDMNLRNNDYVDERSKCDFSKYIKKVVSY